MAGAKSIRKQAASAVKQSNRLFKRSKRDLKYIRGETKDYVKSQNQSINQRYGETISQSQVLTDKLKSELGTQSAQHRDAAMAELQRLGIQGTGMGSFDVDASNQQGVASQLGSNQVANLMAMRSGSREIGGLLKSMVKSQYQSNLGSQVEKRNDDIRAIKMQRNQSLQSLFAQMNAARASGSGSYSSPVGMGPSSSISKILEDADKRRKQKVLDIIRSTSIFGGPGNSSTSGQNTFGGTNLTGTSSVHPT